MKKYVALIVLIFLFGCGRTAESVADEPKTETTEIQVIADDMQKPERAVAEIPEIIDPDGTYMQKDAMLACVIVPALRQRTSPGGDLIMFTKDEPEHTAPLCYFENEIFDDGNYKWIRIADDRWIGTTPDWILEESSDDYSTMYDLEERRTYTESYRPLACGELERISDYYPMTEEEERISWFLKRTIPGMWVGGKEIVEFDARNPSAEAIRDLFFNIYFCEGMNLYGEIPGFSSSDTAIVQYGEVVYGASNGTYEYPLLLQEHLDCYSQKYYGNTIDFRNCGMGNRVYDSYGILYDANYQVFGIMIPSGIGLGEEEEFPFVLNYRQEDGYIYAEVAIVDMYISTDQEEPFWVWDIPNHYSGDDAVDYIKNTAKRYMATIKVTDEGDYQLITLAKADK